MEPRFCLPALLLVGIIAVFAPGCEAPAQTTPWPTEGWPTSSFQEMGLDPEPFTQLHRDVEAGLYGYVDRLVVVKDGHLVMDEVYENDYREISRGESNALGCGWESCEGDPAMGGFNYLHPDWHPYYQGREVHSLQSVTKSVTSALIGIAIGRGQIPGVQAPLLSFFQDYDLSGVDERLHRTTLDDLLTMRSGIEWHENDRPLDETNTTIQLEGSQDWIQFTLDQPMDSDPGERWNYNSGGSHLMSGVIRAATGQYVDAYAQEHLFGPLGIRDYHWKKTPRGYPDTEGGLYLEAEDLAKIGYLYLKDGMWEGQRILPEGWVEASTTRHAEVPGPVGWGYGYQWWLLEIEGVEVWAGMGFGDQFLLVLPELDLIGVANSWNVFDNDRQSIQSGLFRAMLASVEGSDEGPTPTNEPGGTSPTEPQPAEAYPLLTSSGAWCWFGDPRGVRFQGAHDRIYSGWVDGEGSIVVGSLDLGSGEQLQHTLHSEFNKDDHANPSLMVLPDGTVMVFYTSHGSDVSDAMYYRVSQRPEDITAWGERLDIGTNTEGPRGHTYPNPVRLSEEDGRIYLFWRGGNFKPSFSYTDDLVSWAPARTLIQSDVDNAVRPYVKVASNDRDAIHFAFTDGHPRNEPRNSIYYVRYQDGEFTRADGSVMGSMEELPLVHEEADLVYDGTEVGVRAWIWDVAEDEGGHPVIVYTRLPAEDDHRYHYARWTGEEWIDREIVPGGGWFPQTPEGETEPEPHYSGGIVLDHTDPSVVYLSRPVEGVFEIERWWTEDGGESWSSEAITTGSLHDNVRPFVIRGHDASSPTVLWMENHRYRHYLDFDSGIRMAGGNG